MKYIPAVSLSFVTLLFFSSFSALAQGPAARSGGGLTARILDAETGVPVEYASVVLYRSLDSSMAQGTITNRDGRLQLGGLDAGRYYMKVHFMGYEELTVDDIRTWEFNERLDIGELRLRPVAIELDEVEVAAERAPVEYAIDKKVINVDRQLTAASGTAVDALQNVPSVTVELDGTVKLRGSGSFTVLIDGKPTPLDPSDALAQIPASSIENIEIITNPSARYDPEGMSGIINVIMKKEGRSGYSGIMNLNAGLGDKYGTDALFTVTEPGWSFYLGGDYGKRHSTGEERERRSFLEAGNTLFNSTIGDTYRQRDSWGLRGGGSLAFSDKDNLGLNLRLGRRSGDAGSDADFLEWSDNAPEPLRQFIRTSSGRSGRFFSSDLDYRHSFEGKGHELTAQLSFMQRRGEESSRDELFDQARAITSGRITTEDGPMQRMQAKLDYTLPLNSLSKLESGYQYYLFDMEDETSLSDYDTALGRYVLLPEYSRTTEYKRGVHALYAMYAGSLGPLGFQAGLRGEHTDQSVGLTGGAQYEYQLFDLFPTLHASYSITPLQQLMASYTRRIERPRGWYLEPFESWTDAFNVRRGNPEITPEYIDSYELGVQTHIGTSLLSAELYHRVTHDKIEFVRSVYRDNITLRTVQNIGQEIATGLELMLNVDVFTFWDVYLLGNLYNNRIEGALNGEDFSRERFTWNTRLNNTFTLAPGTLLQANVSYNSPSVSAQGRTEGYVVTNIALRQEFLGGRLFATLDVSDVLRTAERESSASGPDFTAYSYELEEAPVAMLTLRYVIGSNGKERKRENRQRDDNGMEEF
ncbi:MAG: TonB-dependent receptor family protein [Bacteroidia bacterium]|nr:TonB-dependent receptor family protein [Bacteroidia bacterium]